MTAKFIKLICILFVIVYVYLQLIIACDRCPSTLCTALYARHESSTISAAYSCSLAYVSHAVLTLLFGCGSHINLPTACSRCCPWHERPLIGTRRACSLCRCIFAICSCVTLRSAWGMHSMQHGDAWQRKSTRNSGRSGTEATGVYMQYFCIEVICVCLFRCNHSYYSCFNFCYLNF